MVVALLAQVAPKPAPEPVGGWHKLRTSSCIVAMETAVERVREAWAPRPVKTDGTWAVSTVGADPCWLECYSQECGIPCDLRKVSSKCLRCATGSAEKAEAEAKAQREREERARAALDAVDAACGVKP